MTKRLLRLVPRRCQTINNQLNAFTSLHLMRELKKKDELGNESTEMKLDVGRAWLHAELSLKSNEDLEKLWFVMQREINRIRSDGYYGKQHLGAKNSQYLKRVRTSMNRVKGLLSERSRVNRLYREFLEDEYARERGKEVKEQLKGGSR